MLGIECFGGVLAAHSNNPTGTTGVLANPVREVVHLFVHNAPTVSGRVLGLNLLDADLFGCVGCGVESTWGD